MLYDITLRISYDYASPAVGGRHLVRLLPLDIAGQQRLVAGHLEITPRPSERFEQTDFFGNRVTEFSHRAPHESIVLKMQARIDRLPGPAPLAATSLAALAGELALCRDMGPDAPLHFLAGSPRAPLDGAMTAYARAAVHPGMTTAEAVAAVAAALYRDIRFDAKATTVDTPAAEAFAKRRGVCQDYSHIMIACLRGIGIPAAYVSGFLRTIPPPGKPRLEGADAMHAWVRAWCGAQAGWVEVDPTNNCTAGADHVVVAYGRDYSDVAPVKGMLRVSGNRKSAQAVDVIPLPG